MGSLLERTTAGHEPWREGVESSELGFGTTYQRVREFRMVLHVPEGVPRRVLQDLLDEVSAYTSQRILLQIPGSTGWSLIPVRFNDETTEYELRRTSDATKSESPRPEHSIRARELRDMTGLPTVQLATGLGVSREQYQRWIQGRPISSTRGGQLAFWHGLACEVERKMGLTAAKTWWQTPQADHVSPADLFRLGMGRRVYDLVTAIAEPDDEDSMAISLPSRDWDDFGAADASEGPAGTTNEQEA